MAHSGKLLGETFFTFLQVQLGGRRATYAAGFSREKCNETVCMVELPWYIYCLKLFYMIKAHDHYDMKNIRLTMLWPAGTTHISNAMQKSQEREQTLRNSKLFERVLTHASEASAGLE
jgi:hypothetical protein